MPRAITLRRAGNYHQLNLKEVPQPVPKPNEVLLKVLIAALNHRDLYIRQNLYPSISFENAILADGCAVVLPHPEGAIASHTFSPGQRVVINPGTGWSSDPTGPEGAYAVIGGTSATKHGTLQEMLAVPAEDIQLAPPHLSDAEAAALPLAGLTAWRAFHTKSGNAAPGRNILVTGIGGGVAIMILLFATAMDCNVFVTSSSTAKIERARELGAKGGVNYTEEGKWPLTLRNMLPKSRTFLDAVIDGAGGDILGNTWKLLKSGGVVVSYGMTSLVQPAMPMQAVMKNIALRGSTMGSRKEFGDMVHFVAENKIRPVVDRVVADMTHLDAIDGLFDDLRKGVKFGKLVVEVEGAHRPHQYQGKL